jgi:tRNA (cmo5U34)-methyltransferase
MGLLSEPNQDQVFKEEINQVSDFKFNNKVAQVFDDMVNRSVPFYGEMQRMIAELAADFVQPGTNVYDLGCSTGTTLIGMDTLIAPDIHFIGEDDSQEMLDKCDRKLQEVGFTRPYSLEVADLNASVKITNASVVVLCLTCSLSALFTGKSW